MNIEGLVIHAKINLHGNHGIGGRDDKGIERNDRWMWLMFEGPDDFHLIPS